MGLLKNTQDFKPSNFDAGDYAGPQFEYRLRNLQKVAGALLERDFNEHGRQGWEFVAWVSKGSDGYAVFKRPV
jgi:hypothetical protein